MYPIGTTATLRMRPELAGLLLKHNGKRVTISGFDHETRRYVVDVPESPTPLLASFLELEDIKFPADDGHSRA